LLLYVMIVAQGGLGYGITSTVTRRSLTELRNDRGRERRAHIDADPHRHEDGGDDPPAIERQAHERASTHC
jgi:hypothetical protein